MNKMIKISNEEETDYERVEEITRKAFWNLYSQPFYYTVSFL
ncbi:hypothetical protein [Clostridium magnum]|uniref:Acetyltransferase n=1 Tax=Clostridium magnum DSM 2767 TaxID=1121326 RepID=A0A162S9E8_9CLOT|nr:hypothetical protein [Clostridium magnum]KZL90943.1 hypothetical protein CLMAG_38540 [Clostridium magnum DSM 2767]SHJ00976.1 hypothetical protein SAMN02745944_05214 [Clostridium magnum DSM 2767]